MLLRMALFFLNYPVRISQKSCRATIGNADDYTQWEYETACGVPVMLATGPDKALIIMDRPEAFLVVNVLDIRWGDTEAGEMTMPREVLETIADAFSFDTVE